MYPDICTWRRSTYTASSPEKYPFVLRQRCSPKKYNTLTLSNEFSNPENMSLDNSCDKMVSVGFMFGSSVWTSRNVGIQLTSWLTGSLNGMVLWESASACLQWVCLLWYCDVIRACIVTSFWPIVLRTFPRAREHFPLSSNWLSLVNYWSALSLAKV